MIGIHGDSANLDAILEILSPLCNEDVIEEVYKGEKDYKSNILDYTFKILKVEEFPNSCQDFDLESRCFMRYVCSYNTTPTTTASPETTTASPESTTASTSSESTTSSSLSVVSSFLMILSLSALFL